MRHQIFVRDIGADKFDFKFSMPDAIKIGGSYSYQCVAKPDVNVDLFIRLPKAEKFLTDGSLGDMLYFHSFCSHGLVVDIVQDIRAINSEAVHANPRKTGMVILGGGLPKHHSANANMMHNGTDYAVFINTTWEFDGSDYGACPDEAVP